MQPPELLVEALSPPPNATCETLFPNLEHIAEEGLAAVGEAPTNEGEIISRMK